MSDLIIVKQIPIIEEKLKSISEEIDKEIKEAKSLVCTEDTKKIVKETRARLNNMFKTLEDERKGVKNAVLEPYNNFEKIYKEFVSDKFKSADIELKEKIDTVENELKTKKEQDVKDYFNEYLKSKNIDFITYEQARINVTLTASIKSLKEQAKAFIDKVSDDLILIETQENKEEILVEYKQDLNVSRAITVVANRIKAIEEEKEKQEEMAKKIKTQSTTVIIKEEPKIEVLGLEKHKQKIQVTLIINEDEKRAIKEYFEIANINYESEEL